MSAPTRPVLRYHGGKWRLAPWILSFFPAHQCYVELYGGAASVLMRKPRVHHEVYNDLNADVVNLFRVLRDPSTALALHQTVRLTAFAREEFEASDYSTAVDPIERARQLLVRSFMGFGAASFHAPHATGFRANSKRRGAGAAHDWMTWPDQVTAFTERLRGVVIEARPAVQVLAQHDAPDVLFYADPPYPHSTRGSGRGIRQKYSHELTDDDHRGCAEELRRARGMVVLSGGPCPLYDHELYADWERHERPHLADGKTTTEVVWLNPACARALRRERQQGVLLFESGGMNSLERA